MNQFQLFASPWWVNLFILVPFLAYYNWQGKLSIPARIFVYTAAFGAAFGFMEAATVIYLRGSLGLLAGGAKIFQELVNSEALSSEFSRRLFLIETFRETATIAMLIAIALATVSKRYNRWAIFFWVFAFWDIFYYAGLKLILGWPQSLFTVDILFLIPVPWYSQVWYPILISALLILFVIAGRNKFRKK